MEPISHTTIFWIGFFFGGLTGGLIVCVIVGRMLPKIL